MTAAVAAATAPLLAICPLCHTQEPALTSDALLHGAAWRCARCDQRWSALRLQTTASYDEAVASGLSRLSS